MIDGRTQLVFPGWKHKTPCTSLLENCTSGRLHWPWCNSNAVLTVHVEHTNSKEDQTTLCQSPTLKSPQLLNHKEFWQESDIIGKPMSPSRHRACQNGKTITAQRKSKQDGFSNTMFHHGFCPLNAPCLLITLWKLNNKTKLLSASIHLHFELS